MMEPRVSLEIMAMKEYSTLPRSPEIEPHHHIQFRVIPWTHLLGQSYPYVEDSQCFQSLANWVWVKWTYLYIYIYMYTYSHPQTAYFIVSQLFSVARHTRCFQLKLADFTSVRYLTMELSSFSALVKEFFMYFFLHIHYCLQRELDLGRGVLMVSWFKCWTVEL